jgi:hypothetical protein
MPHSTRSWGVLLTGLALAACGFESRDADDGGTDADADGDTDGDTDGETDTGPTPPGCDRIDVLLVLDSRGNTAELRFLVAESARHLLVDLAGHLESAGHPVDLRFGITTAAVARSYTWVDPPVSQNEPEAHDDTGPDGALIGFGSCNLTSEPWVQVNGDEPYLSANQVHCIVTGIQTSPAFLAMHLAAIHQALGTDPEAYPGVPAQSAPGQPNEGFYRDEPGTLLAVIAVAATDDCSVAQGASVVGDPLAPASCVETGSTGLYPPAAVAEFLESITDDGERLAFAALAPDPDAEGWYTCAPARRLGELTDLLGPAASFDDLCDGGLNVEEPFESMAEHIIERCDAMAGP